jgi:hypothetical protein
MRIAFCVEGSADRAILYGLRDRWCRDAELMEGRFRGQLPRSQIPKECKVLSAKGADLIIFLRDANLENWREVLRADMAKCPPAFRHIAVFGVCDRNAECWVAADPGHLASRIGRPLHELQSQDPSPFVKAGFGMIGFDAQEKEAGVAGYVANAPIRRWLTNDSFQNFYDQLWQKSKERGCQIENLRDSQGTPTA